MITAKIERGQFTIIAKFRNTTIYIVGSLSHVNEVLEQRVMPCIKKAAQ